METGAFSPRLDNVFNVAAALYIPVSGSLRVDRSRRHGGLVRQLPPLARHPAQTRNGGDPALRLLAAAGDRVPMPPRCDPGSESRPPPCSQHATNLVLGDDGGSLRLVAPRTVTPRMTFWQCPIHAMAYIGHTWAALADL